jgi:hypothetical protein
MQGSPEFAFADGLARKPASTFGHAWQTARGVPHAWLQVSAAKCGEISGSYDFGTIVAKK